MVFFALFFLLLLLRILVELHLRLHNLRLFQYAGHERLLQHGSAEFSGREIKTDPVFIQGFDRSEIFKRV